jgi:hypothetical protein
MANSPRWLRAGIEIIDFESLSIEEKGESEVEVTYRARQ